MRSYTQNRGLVIISATTLIVVEFTDQRSPYTDGGGVSSVISIVPALMARVSLMMECIMAGSM